VAQDIEQIIAEQDTPFSGAVLVRRGSEVVHAQGYGMAYRAESIPNTIDTRFATASGTKTFTATAICQLADQGKIDLHAPITEYIDAELPPYDPGVTVHHLLTHTSGIPDYLDESVLQTRADYEALYARFPLYTLRRPADYLPMFPTGAMHFKPGAEFRYCNGGFILLAMIVEEQSGMPYAEYVNQNVFTRAGMSRSGLFEADQFPAGTAYGYFHDKTRDVWRSNIFSLPIIGGGDGGAYVTAPDMATFWDALFGGQLLSPSMRDMMLKAHTITNEHEDDDHYGYGLWIRTDESATITRYSAMGGDIGVDFVSTVFPQHDTLVTVISNVDAAFMALYEKICAALA
jgi:CubicO group peptidase (beta-lactamase class C family)